MALIQVYNVPPGQSIKEALWASGVYRKEDVFNQLRTVYDTAFLCNGLCANCRGSATDHQPWCPGARMEKITNLIFPLCAVCHYSRVDHPHDICPPCSEEAELCSCNTPDYCSALDRHDEAYFAKKRTEWKAKLAELGIKTE